MIDPPDAGGYGLAPSEVKRLTLFQLSLITQERKKLRRGIRAVEAQKQWVKERSKKWAKKVK